MNKTTRKLPKVTNYKVTKEDVHVDGLLYYYENSNFSRLPTDKKFDDALTHLAKHPSGAYISFITNSSSIGVNVKLAGKSYMAHFTATGTIGLDLYVLHEDNFVFLGTTKLDEAEFSYTFIRGMSRVNKEFRIYLPIYMELIDLEIVVDANARIRQDKKEDKPKLVCYGTSITQGGCATRPGMNYTSIMGRHLPHFDVYNLGFSGNAHLHTEIANVISDIKNLDTLIIEVEANAGAESGVLIDRLENFLDIIIEKNPKTKMFLISHYPHSHSLFNPSLKARILKHKIFQKDVCNKYNITFVDGEELLKEFGYEETVDLVHLTDLGFYHLAHYFIDILSKK